MEQELSTNFTHTSKQGHSDGEIEQEGSAKEGHA
jgi:hypothetical protein